MLCQLLCLLKALMAGALAATLDHEVTTKREVYAEDERSLGVGAPSHPASLPLDSIPIREE